MKSRQIRMMLKARMKLPMNLQLFAGDDGGEGGAGGGNDNGDAGGDGNGDDGGDGGNEGGKEQTFDDFLSDAKNQAEFDRRVAKAVAKAVSKAQKSWQDQTDEAATEAERLAAMNEAEKAKYKADKRAKDLDAREAKLAHRELIAETKSMLSDKGLDPSLADVIVRDGMDAEACTAAVENLEKAFRTSNEAAVKQALKGTKPMKKGDVGGGPEDDLKKQIHDAVTKGFF